MGQLASRACEEVEACRRQLAAAQQQSGALALQLAGRNKLVEALQAQLRTVAAGSIPAGSSGGAGVAEGTQTEALLAAPPPPVGAAALAGLDGSGGVAADALGSLDRIVGFWRQACEAKDGQLARLRGELEQVCV